VTGTCGTCGYNDPWHETRCPERGLSDLEIRCEIANMSDALIREACTRCGGPIGAAGAVIHDGGLAHKHRVCCDERLAARR
jgi:hypothetical protein